jgi:hypothetical protein
VSPHQRREGGLVALGAEAAQQRAVALVGRRLGGRQPPQVVQDGV